MTTATTIAFDLAYAGVAVGLVLHLARTLRRHGESFLRDVFDDEALSAAVNQLLVIGFYLLNLGYAVLLLRTPEGWSATDDPIGRLSVQLGVLLLSLGVAHLFNMLVFWRIRTHRDRIDRYRAMMTPPPPPPVGPGPGRPFTMPGPARPTAP